MQTPIKRIDWTPELTYYEIRAFRRARLDLYGPGTHGERFGRMLAMGMLRAQGLTYKQVGALFGVTTRIASLDCQRAEVWMERRMAFLREYGDLVFES